MANQSSLSLQLPQGMRITAEIKPGFEDVWAELGWTQTRESRFRALFTVDTTSLSDQGKHKAWKVASASNGRFSAEDTGPLAGNYESDNVPPTIEAVAPKMCVQ